MNETNQFETWAVKGDFLQGDERWDFDASRWAEVGPELVGQPLQGIVRRPKFCVVCGVRIGHELHLDDGKPYCREHCPACSVPQR